MRELAAKEEDLDRRGILLSIADSYDRLYSKWLVLAGAGMPTQPSTATSVPRPAPIESAGYPPLI
jgi:hypothetical protein